MWSTKTTPPRPPSIGHYGHFITVLIFHLLVYRVDSTMLIEEGFQVVSVDASDKMLKYALKERWNRRKDPGFDDWGKVTPSLNTKSFSNFIAKFLLLFLWPHYFCFSVLFMQ